MNEQEFQALFGTTGKDGRQPTVCAVTGQRLHKTDHITRQRIPGTTFYVMYALPLSGERLAELEALAKTGMKSTAAKAPAKDEG